MWTRCSRKRNLQYIIIGCPGQISNLKRMLKHQLQNTMPRAKDVGATMRLVPKPFMFLLQLTSDLRWSEKSVLIGTATQKWDLESHHVSSLCESDHDSVFKVSGKLIVLHAVWLSNDPYFTLKVSMLSCLQNLHRLPIFAFPLSSVQIRGVQQRRNIGSRSGPLLSCKKFPRSTTYFRERIKHTLNATHRTEQQVWCHGSIPLW